MDQDQRRQDLWDRFYANGKTKSDYELLVQAYRDVGTEIQTYEKAMSDDGSTQNFPVKSDPAPVH